MSQPKIACVYCNNWITPKADYNNAGKFIDASSPENVIVIGHGFYGRLVRELYEKTGDHIFDILNSKNFQFRNLDVMKIERCQVTNVWRNDETVSY